ncbi:four helix bundle protein [candidate division KSB1 bacterium]|nr:four helix bundle protein [candidate division KSB1 bacterium]RQW01974.1 MAG: four helix bundle protein [candidate division KSB1 bacterium]
MNRRDLENRLVDFAVLIIKISELLPKTRAGNTLSNQIVRSGTSPALNYGEAQSAESKKDFVHKLKIILKELRETFICLKIIKKAKLLEENDILEYTMHENDELIAIFVSSLKTVQQQPSNMK